MERRSPQGRVTPSIRSSTSSPRPELTPRATSVRSPGPETTSSNISPTSAAAEDGGTSCGSIGSFTRDEENRLAHLKSQSKATLTSDQASELDALEGKYTEFIQDGLAEMRRLAASDLNTRTPVKKDRGAGASPSSVLQQPKRVLARAKELFSLVQRRIPKLKFGGSSDGAGAAPTARGNSNEFAFTEMFSSFGNGRRPTGGSSVSGSSSSSCRSLLCCCLPRNASPKSTVKMGILVTVVCCATLLTVLAYDSSTMVSTSGTGTGWGSHPLLSGPRRRSSLPAGDNQQNQQDAGGTIAGAAGGGDNAATAQHDPLGDDPNEPGAAGGIRAPPVTEAPPMQTLAQYLHYVSHFLEYLLATGLAVGSMTATPVSAASNTPGSTPQIFSLRVKLLVVSPLLLLSLTNALHLSSCALVELHAVLIQGLGFLFPESFCLLLGCGDVFLVACSAAILFFGNSAWFETAARSSGVGPASVATIAPSTAGGGAAQPLLGSGTPSG